MSRPQHIASCSPGSITNSHSVYCYPLSKCGCQNRTRYYKWSQFVWFCLLWVQFRVGKKSSFFQIKSGFFSFFLHYDKLLNTKWILHQNNINEKNSMWWSWFYFNLGIIHQAWYTLLHTRAGLLSIKMEVWTSGFCISLLLMCSVMHLFSIFHGQSGLSMSEWWCGRMA